MRFTFWIDQTEETIKNSELYKRLKVYDTYRSSYEFDQSGITIEMPKHVTHWENIPLGVETPFKSMQSLVDWLDNLE